MRIHEFRAWYIDSHKMLNNVFPTQVENNQAVYMQWIGITDINDEKIFEGDIVEVSEYINDKPQLFKGTVTYSAENLAYYLQLDNDNESQLADDNMLIEIIGNIYEGIHSKIS